MAGNSYFYWECVVGRYMQEKMLLVPRNLVKNVRVRYIEDNLLLRDSKQEKIVSDKRKVFYVPNMLDKTSKSRYSS